MTKKAPPTAINVKDIFTGQVRKGKTMKQSKGKFAKVKVSKKLRAKIHKVIDSKEVKGSLKQYFMGMAIPLPSVPNRITWYRGFDAKPPAIADAVGYSSTKTDWSFTLPQFLDAASMIFNRKADGATGARYDPSSTGNFAFNSVKFTVKSCSTDYIIKNLSDATICICAIECAPRVKQGMNLGEANPQTTLYSYTGAENQTDTTTVQNVLTVVAASYTVDNNSKVWVGNSNSIWDNATSSTGMGVLPTEWPQFKRQLKTSHTHIALNPGQTYTYKMVGPKNFVYDGAKTQKSEHWGCLTPVARTMLVGVYTEPQASKLFDTANYKLIGTRNYTADTDAALSNGLIIERIDNYVIEMPEATSGLISVTPNIVDNTLQYRRPWRLSMQYHPPGTYTVAGSSSIKDITELAPNATTV